MTEKGTIYKNPLLSPFTKGRGGLIKTLTNSPPYRGTGQALYERERMIVHSNNSTYVLILSRAFCQ